MKTATESNGFDGDGRGARTALIHLLRLHPDDTLWEADTQALLHEAIMRIYRVAETNPKAGSELTMPLNHPGVIRAITDRICEKPQTEENRFWDPDGHILIALGGGALDIAGQRAYELGSYAEYQLFMALFGCAGVALNATAMQWLGKWGAESLMTMPNSAISEAIRDTTPEYTRRNAPWVSWTPWTVPQATEFMEVIADMVNAGLLSRENLGAWVRRELLIERDSTTELDGGGRQTEQILAFLEVITKNPKMGHLLDPATAEYIIRLGKGKPPKPEPWHDHGGEPDTNPDPALHANAENGHSLECKTAPVNQNLKPWVKMDHRARIEAHHSTATHPEFMEGDGWRALSRITQAIEAAANPSIPPGIETALGRIAATVDPVWIPNHLEECTDIDGLGMWITQRHFRRIMQHQERSAQTGTTEKEGTPAQGCQRQALHGNETPEGTGTGGLRSGAHGQATPRGKRTGTGTGPGGRR